jgi:hypothetical protein
MIKFTSISLILAICAEKNQKMKQFDIKTAFLYDDLTNEIYMEQPKGYNDKTRRVCKL